MANGLDTDLFDRLKKYAFDNQLNSDNVLGPPCKKQGNFKSVGTLSEHTPYLHVRREP